MKTQSQPMWLAIFLLSLTCSLWGQSSPVLRIVKAEIGDTLRMTYVIQNGSPKPIFVYSPFLREPLDGEFDRKRGNEVIWLTFKPRFVGNYSSNLDFIELKPGDSFTGEMEYPFGGKQIANCTSAPHVNITLSIGWGFGPLKKDPLAAPESINAVALVKQWQSITTSRAFVVSRTGKANPRECPIHQDVEIWR
jgi:hypothetical protein